MQPAIKRFKIARRTCWGDNFRDSGDFLHLVLPWTFSHTSKFMFNFIRKIHPMYVINSMSVMKRQRSCIFCSTLKFDIVMSMSSVMVTDLGA